MKDGVIIFQSKKIELPVNNLNNDLSNEMSDNSREQDKPEVSVLMVNKSV